MTIKRKRMAAEKDPAVSDSIPSLRPGLEVIALPAEQNHTAWGLRDVWKLSPQLVAMSEDLLYVLQFFDGHHTAREICLKYLKKYQSLLLPEQLDSLVQALDEHYYLQNERFLARMEEVRDDYRRLGVRPAQHSGISYSDKPDQLRREMAAFEQPIQQSHSLVNRILNRPIHGLVVPHIDLRNGGSAYAHAYRYAAQSQPADLYVILGIAHQGLTTVFCPTILDFETALGTVQTDREVLAEIDRLTTRDYYQQEFLHLQEHSIEFQTVFLRYALNNDIKILPILCSFPHTLLSDTSRSDPALEYYREFMTALKTVLSSYAGRICYLASVDFSHVGPMYGDEHPPTQQDIARIEQHDRTIIACLQQHDVQGLLHLIADGDNPYHVCGFAALVPFLELLPPSRGDLLEYGSAQMDSQRSTVTFCSMIFS